MSRPGHKTTVERPADCPTPPPAPTGPQRASGNPVRTDLMRHMLLLPALFCWTAVGCTQPTATTADPPAKEAEGGQVATEWSSWRGPEQNGVSRERDLPEKFSLDAS